MFHCLTLSNSINHDYVFRSSIRRVLRGDKSVYKAIDMSTADMMVMTKMTSSNGSIFRALLALCEGNPSVTGGFPWQRPVTQSFGVFFDVCLNKRLSKQSWCRWFETASSPLWHDCNECTCSISHNSPFRTFLFWMEHCGIWNGCILGFVNQVNWKRSNMRKSFEWIYVNNLDLKMPIMSHDSAMARKWFPDY